MALVKGWKDKMNFLKKKIESRGLNIEIFWKVEMRINQKRFDLKWKINVLNILV